MLSPDMSRIHIHNLPVQAAREQAVTAGGLALLQELCKHRNWTPAATAPKQYFRVSRGTSAQRRNQSIKPLLQPGLADSGLYRQQDPGSPASYPGIMYPSLLSATLKRHSVLSHFVHRSYSISMVTLSYLLPFSEPFLGLIYPLERGEQHTNQSVCESQIYTVAQWHFQFLISVPFPIAANIWFASSSAAETQVSPNECPEMFYSMLPLIECTTGNCRRMLLFQNRHFQTISYLWFCV